MGERHGAVFVRAREDEEADFLGEFANVVFAKQLHHVMTHDPHDVKIAGDRFVHNLPGVKCVRAGHAQQRCPLRVGILVRFNKEVVRRPGFRRHRCGDFGARNGLENLPNQEEFFIGQLSRGDHANACGFHGG